MPADRYTRFMLTVIAGALVYLCAVLGPMPAVGALAQVPPLVRPGDPTGPVQVVVVDWQTRIPVAVELPNPTRVEVENPVRIAGPVPVTTERSTGRADRVVLVGWEERSTAEKAATFTPLDPKAERGSIPVRTVP
jgi:hypothetical protein